MGCPESKIVEETPEEKAYWRYTAWLYKLVDMYNYNPWVAYEFRCKGCQAVKVGSMNVCYYCLKSNCRECVASLKEVDELDLISKLNIFQTDVHVCKACYKIEKEKK